MRHFLKLPIGATRIDPALEIARRKLTDIFQIQISQSKFEFTSPLAIQSTIDKDGDKQSI